MNQSQFLAITCNSLQAREKSRVHGTIGFAFASHWFKNWRESFKPITKRSNRNHVITFDSHLKTALLRSNLYLFNCPAFVFLQIHLPSLTTFSNWPSSRTPLRYVHSFDFSPNSGYLSIGNDSGSALLFRYAIDVLLRRSYVCTHFTAALGLL